VADQMRKEWNCPGHAPSQQAKAEWPRKE
jgi:hypothetical protein